MKAKLVSYSVPTEEFKNLGLDNVQDLVAYCAKVSNPSNQINKETSERLIKYLIQHQHWSPLEMVSACLEIETTRDIAHQIGRHRSFSFQEFSQRYADPTTMEDWYELREARLQDTKNRQNSIDDLSEFDIQEFQMQISQHLDTSMWLYKQMLSAGVAKECARDILPMSSKTKLYMHGTLRSWLTYCDLRTSNGTQLEHQVIAEQCKELISLYFPKCFAAMWVPL